MKTSPLINRRPMLRLAALAPLGLLIAACGQEGTPEGTPQEGSTSNADAPCTERDGAWFGRTPSGSIVTTQTREACEQRVSP
ncbi:hypothetical protein [Polycyclovorans algicola]|uniref:hypothetical protein n=1 Tax=Polycyclovorans algicola TaxID=616992 RepID=UPI001268FC28|nr:hypothetical protein [Polycyclovorans algicola]